MQISDFDFDLPQELIAQEPLAERDGSRLLVIDRSDGNLDDRSFLDLPSLLSSNDVLVINNTKVFPARLVGHRVSDLGQVTRVEALLVKRHSPTEWEVMAKPGRALPVGARLLFGAELLGAKVVGINPDGRRILKFEAVGDLDAAIDRIGNTPLPPYIKRVYAEHGPLNDPRYQTIYAASRGAIAAPTAGLHFTERVFDGLRRNGVEVIEITHHVGAATFQPVRVDEVESHRIESEDFEITRQAAARLNHARSNRKRIIAVGTTTTRALESAVDDNGIFAAGHGSTELFIYPGYRFRATDALVTNFHLPKSSLLVLVAAFGGRDLVLAAYRHAVSQRYRFYSFGDCMLIH